MRINCLNQARKPLSPVNSKHAVVWRVGDDTGTKKVDLRFILLFQKEQQKNKF